MVIKCYSPLTNWDDPPGTWLVRSIVACKHCGSKWVFPEETRLYTSLPMKSYRIRGDLMILICFPLFRVKQPGFCLWLFVSCAIFFLTLRPIDLYTFVAMKTLHMGLHLMTLPTCHESTSKDWIGRKGLLSTIQSCFWMEIEIHAKWCAIHTRLLPSLSRLGNTYIGQKLIGFAKWTPYSGQIGL